MRGKSSHNIGFDQSQFADLGDLERAIMTVLQSCIGRDNAIVKGKLLRYIRDNPLHRNVKERQVRAAINRLRQSGAALICSTGGIRGGYWIAKDRAELEEFFDAEILSRLRDLNETKTAMDRAADRLLGKASPQNKMFDF